jgi:5-methylcytosine-specific restriction endonuclease McrA
MIARRRLSTADRVRIFQASAGLCHICGGKIHVGEAWDVSHEIPLELCGADDDTNMRPAHRKCHRIRTSETDIPDIARAKRREAKHLGAKVKRPWHPTKKRKLNGEVVDR